MEAKSKTTAVLLAVFLGPATYIYTYREDGRKFWVWAGVIIAALVFSAVAPTLTFFTTIAGLVFFVGTIIRVAKRPLAWYANYNSEVPAQPRTQHAA